jgi:uncharacterized repeat protein (TIGR03803 family)
MKSRILMCITAMTLFAGLAVPVRLAAQDNHNGNQAPAQTFTVLHTFTGSPDDGACASNILRDGNGTLYSTTYFGGLYGFGTVFKLDKSGKETVLYSFTGGADGALPNDNLVRDEEGNLYGTTQDGGLACTVAAQYGENGCGVVFKLDTRGKETVLYSFSGGADGGMPGSVAMDRKGNFYGITSYGGNMSCSVAFLPGYGCGAVFKLDRSGNETVLHSFSGVPDGALPYPFLTMDESGNIYGASQLGGSSPNPEVCLGWGCGVVYKLDSGGILTALHTFTGGADGFVPNGPLLLDDEGNLYGTAEWGGNLTCNSPLGCGVVFKLDRRGNETVLHTFTDGADGAIPNIGMSWDLEGNLLGTAAYGGDPTCNSGFGCGVVFKLDRRGKETVLHSFAGSADGAFPNELVTVDRQGNLYSDTNGGGDLSCETPFAPWGCGVVFKLKP